MEDIYREGSRLSKDQIICRNDHQMICLIHTEAVNVKQSLVSCPIRLLLMAIRTETC